MRDRSVEFPERYRLKKVPGTDDVYDLTPAPGEISEEGTPINKATLLTDETAGKYGFGSDAVVNDVLKKLSDSAQYKPIPLYALDGKLSDISEGETVFVDEDGNTAEFYVAKINYESDLNGEGRILLVRKDCTEQRQWDSSNINSYADSDIDVWLNSEYKEKLSKVVQNAMGETSFYYTIGNGDAAVSTLQRSVFLLSCTELDLSYNPHNEEGSALPIASKLKPAYFNGAGVISWTRSPQPNTATNVIILNSSGTAGTSIPQDSRYPRPCFTLPSDFPIYTDSEGNYHTEQAYKYAITDLDGNKLFDVEYSSVIATGTYNGVRKHGENNPTAIICPFVPKLVYVTSRETGSSDYCCILVPISSSFTPIGTVFARAGTQNSYLYTRIEGNIVQWYHPSSDQLQCDEAGKIYDWVAIG